MVRAQRSLVPAIAAALLVVTAAVAAAVYWVLTQ
jgi:hypothetical protein